MFEKTYSYFRAILILMSTRKDHMTYQPFIHALLWNALHVFLYKIILQTHQACLFYVISKELFGISGTLFSIIYLLISFSNFGFDYSLFAFYRYYINSQSNFRQLAQQFIIRIATILMFTATLYFLLIKFGNIPQIYFVTQYVPPSMIPILLSVFISESLKKSLEVFAHLAFLNKTITVLEIITLLSYTGLVWGSYFIQGHINLYTIFIPMAITSWIELCVLLKRLYSFYQTLPEQPLQATSTPSTKTIAINQMTNYVNQITKALFSPNFIIIFLAYHLGMTRAGYIKLIIDIIILLYMLLNRAVGIPSGALLSTNSGINRANPQSFKEIFLKITNGYIQFLYALAATLIGLISPCLVQSSCFGSIIITNTLLFAFAGFLEYVIITYEKLYLTQGAAKKLAIINAISLLMLIPALYATKYMPSAYLLIPFILARMISILIIAITVFKIWGIAPCFKIHKVTLLFIISLCTLILLWHTTT